LWKYENSFIFLKLSFLELNGIYHLLKGCQKNNLWKCFGNKFKKPPPQNYLFQTLFSRTKWYIPSLRTSRKTLWKYENGFIFLKLCFLELNGIYHLLKGRQKNTLWKCFGNKFKKPPPQNYLFKTLFSRTKWYIPSLSFPWCP